MGSLSSEQSSCVGRFGGKRSPGPFSYSASPHHPLLVLGRRNSEVPRTSCGLRFAPVVAILASPGPRVTHHPLLRDGDYG